MTERVRLGTSILIMPLRNPVLLAKELATLQFLSENRMILGAGVGWNDAEYEAVGVHKSERGKRTDEMLDIMLPLLEGETVTLPRPLLLGRRRVHRADGVAAAGALDRRRLAAGRPQVAGPAPLRRVGQGARPALPTAGSRARPARPTDIARDWVELQAYYREHGRDPDECVVAHENFLHLVLTERPGQGARGAAPGVPQGDERRARTGLPRVGLPVRHAGRGDRLAPGPRRRRRRVLRPAHDDARSGPAPGLGRRDHPERHVPGHGRSGPAHGARACR